MFSGYKSERTTGQKRKRRKQGGALDWGNREDHEQKTERGRGRKKTAGDREQKEKKQRDRGERGEEKKKAEPRGRTQKTKRKARRGQRWGRTEA